MKQGHHGQKSCFINCFLHCKCSRDKTNSSHCTAQPPVSDSHVQLCHRYSVVQGRQFLSKTCRNQWDYWTLTYGGSRKLLNNTEFETLQSQKYSICQLVQWAIPTWSFTAMDPSFTIKELRGLNTLQSALSNGYTVLLRVVPRID